MKPLARAALLAGSLTISLVADAHVAQRVASDQAPNITVITVQYKLGVKQDREPVRRPPPVRRDFLAEPVLSPPMPDDGWKVIAVEEITVTLPVKKAVTKKKKMKRNPCGSERQVWRTLKNGHKKYRCL